MGALDGVLSEAESRFGISNTKATFLMSNLLGLIQGQSGGFERVSRSISSSGSR